MVEAWKRTDILDGLEPLALTLLDHTACVLLPALQTYAQLIVSQQCNVAQSLRVFFRLSRRCQPSSRNALESILDELLSTPSTLHALPPWVRCKLLSAVDTLPPASAIFASSLKQVTTGLLPLPTATCTGCQFLAAPAPPAIPDVTRAQLTLYRKAAAMLVQTCGVQESLWTLLVECAGRFTCSQCLLSALIKLVMVDDVILYSTATALLGLSSDRQAALGLASTTTFATVLEAMQATPSGLVEATLDDGAAFLEFLLAGLRAFGAEQCAESGYDGSIDFPIPLLRAFRQQLSNYNAKGLVPFNVGPLLRRLAAVVGEGGSDE